MKVRVKEGEKGFYGNKLYREGEEFTLVKREHSRNKDDKGKPVVITPEQQFSEKWMEKVNPGPKPTK
jgi:hypothetical protein